MSRKQNKKKFIRDYKKIFENIKDLIQSVDEKGNFIDVNKTELQKLGYTKKEMLKMNIKDILPKEDRKRCHAIFEKIKNGEIITDIEAVFLTKKGKKIYVEGNVTGLFDKEGNFLSTLGIFRDITKKVNLEKDLKNSELKFRSTVEIAKDPIVLFDEKLRFYDFNNQFTKELGYTKKDLIGKNILTSGILTKKTLYETWKYHIKCKKHDTDTPKYEVTLISTKGEKVPYELSSGHFTNSDGKTVIQAIFRNITDRKEAMDKIRNEKRKVETEKEKLNTFLKSIGDAAVAFNKKQEIILFNPVAEEITGIDREEALGKKFKDVIKFVDEELNEIDYSIIEDTLKNGKKTSIPKGTFLLKSEDEKIPIADSISPLKNGKGKIIGSIIIFSDITKEYEIDKLKSNFIGVVSHQLKTPLNSVKWLTETLLTQKDLTKENLEIAEDIQTTNERMIKIVNKLLTISRIESQRAKPIIKPTNLEEIIDNIYMELLTNFKEKNHKFKITKKGNLKKVNIDDNFIYQILENLLSNSIKYSPHGSKISLKIKSTKKNLECVVKDNGYGIPKNEQKYIFNKFFRAENTQKKGLKGTGLGLSIIKSLIELMGGKIWFKSKLNKGTSFHISIPLQKRKRKKT